MIGNQLECYQSAPINKQKVKKLTHNIYWNPTKNYFSPLKMFSDAT